MRDYGKVHATFWSSGTIAGISDKAKMLALYLMTCSHGSISGAFRLPDGYVAEDMGMEPAAVALAFSELAERGFAVRCEATKWVWIKKHLVWNKPENPNQRKAAAKASRSIPDGCSWLAEFHSVCGPLLSLEPLQNPSETVPDRVPKPVTVTVAVTNTSVAKATGGEPPAVDEDEAGIKDPRRELYQAGKSLLAEQGMPKAQTGSFITKLAQDYGQDAALEAVRSAVSNRPLEAAAYLKAACRRLKGERRDPITVPSTDTGADKFKAAMDERAATATRPPAAILALAGKAIERAA